MHVTIWLEILWGKALDTSVMSLTMLDYKVLCQLTNELIIYYSKINKLVPLGFWVPTCDWIEKQMFCVTVESIATVSCTFLHLNVSWVQLDRGEYSRVIVFLVILSPAVWWAK